MINLNDNILCAIDVETTGLDPLVNEIVEFACIPLTNDLEPYPTITPFHIIMKPSNLEAVDFEALRTLKTYDESFDLSDVGASRSKLLDCMNRGITQERGADLFVEWFENLQLKPKKRIVPLAHNWIFDSGFIKSWVLPKTYDYVFDGRYRDTMCIGGFLNDYAEWSLNFQIPFPKLKLTLLANKLGIEMTRAHNALVDAYTTSQVYKRILQGLKFSPRVEQENGSTDISKT